MAQTAANFGGRSDAGELPRRFQPLLVQVRRELRSGHYALRTEEMYRTGFAVSWPLPSPAPARR